MSTDGSRRPNGHRSGRGGNPESASKSSTVPTKRKDTTAAQFEKGPSQSRPLTFGPSSAATKPLRKGRGNNKAQISRFEKYHA